MIGFIQSFVLFVLPTVLLSGRNSGVAGQRQRIGNLGMRSCSDEFKCPATGIVNRFVFPLFTMCNETSNVADCYSLPRMKQNKGLKCGPCPTAGPTTRPNPLEACPSENKCNPTNLGGVLIPTHSYTMCEMDTRTEECFSLPRVKLGNGYICGPCPKKNPTSSPTKKATGILFGGLGGSVGPVDTTGWRGCSIKDVCDNTKMGPNKFSVCNPMTGEQKCVFVPSLYIIRGFQCGKCLGLPYSMNDTHALIDMNSTVVTQQANSTN